MTKKINPKAVVVEGKTSIFIFFYPVMILLSIIVYLIKSKNLDQFLIFMFAATLAFLPAFFNYYNKSIVITKKSIYVFVRGKQILKWSLEEDFYLVDIRQDRLGSLLGYGTLVLVNRDKKLYEYFFLANASDVQTKLFLSYEKIMKKLDPNYISPYNLIKQSNEEKLDVIEDDNET
jgi:hypothetical protein